MSILPLCHPWAIFLPPSHHLGQCREGPCPHCPSRPPWPWPTKIICIPDLVAILQEPGFPCPLPTTLNPGHRVLFRLHTRKAQGWETAPFWPVLGKQNEKYMAKMQLMEWPPPKSVYQDRVCRASSDKENSGQLLIDQPHRDRDTHLDTETGGH